MQTEVTKKDHIGICICTFKRPEFLNNLLLKLREQVTEDLFDYSISIVDNDKCESARGIVENCSQTLKIPILYLLEPIQNIALARNKVIEHSQGNFIALIDDDEFPINHWLLTLYKCLRSYNVDGVLGPVLPYFEIQPPKWVTKGGFFERRNHSSGHELEWQNTRTGNALLKRQIFDNNMMWFDPKFGSGGEDRDFFRRRLSEGRKFIWCREAPVYEKVPALRWEISVLTKRALLRGKMAFNAGESGVSNIFKSFIAVLIYSLLLPFLFVIGKHLLVKYLIKICDHLGKILAYFKIDVIKEKYIT